MAVVSMNYLLESGVHFGHQTKRWNPKMKEYIFTSRDDIYIIDLQKTAKKLEEAYAVLKEIATNGGKVLFVGTRKQAQEATKDEAIRTKSYYVNTRWLGGTLTNFKTIRHRVKRLEQIEKMETDGTFELLPKKEVIHIKKEYDKLNNVLCGIRDMYKLPAALFIVDPSKETNAILEARKLKIPVFGIVDTNCDPDMVDYVIPGNDDAIRAVKLIIGVMANAVAEANGLEVVDYVSDDRIKDDKDIMEKALETVKRREDRPRRFDNKRPYNKDRKPYDHPHNDRPRNDRPYPPRPKEDRVPTAEIKKVEAVAPIAPVKEADVKEVIENTTDFSGKTVSELREMAKTNGVKGYSTMKKADLISALQ